jgi:hypothetical protein
MSVSTFLRSILPKYLLIDTAVESHEIISTMLGMVTVDTGSVEDLRRILPEVCDVDVTRRTVPAVAYERTDSLV